MTNDEYETTLQIGKIRAALKHFYSEELQKRLEALELSVHIEEIDGSDYERLSFAISGKTKPQPVDDLV